MKNSTLKPFQKTAFSHLRARAGQKTAGMPLTGFNEAIQGGAWKFKIEILEVGRG